MASVLPTDSGEENVGHAEAEHSDYCSVLVEGSDLTKIKDSLVDKLTIEFQTRARGGEDIKEVEIISICDHSYKAKITYFDKKVVKSVQQYNHIVLGKRVAVKPWTPVKDIKEVPAENQSIYFEVVAHGHISDLPKESLERVCSESGVTIKTVNDSRDFLVKGSLNQVSTVNELLLHIKKKENVSTKVDSPINKITADKRVNRIVLATNFDQTKNTKSSDLQASDLASSNTNDDDDFEIINKAEDPSNEIDEGNKKITDDVENECPPPATDETISELPESRILSRTIYINNTSHKDEIPNSKSQDSTKKKCTAMGNSDVDATANSREYDESSSSEYKPDQANKKDSDTTKYPEKEKENTRIVTPSCNLTDSTCEKDMVDGGKHSEKDMPGGRQKEKDGITQNKLEERKSTVATIDSIVVIDNVSKDPNPESDLNESKNRLTSSPVSEKKEDVLNAGMHDYLNKVYHDKIVSIGKDFGVNIIWKPEECTFSLECIHQCECDNIKRAKNSLSELYICVRSNLRQEVVSLKSGKDIADKVKKAKLLIAEFTNVVHSEPFQGKHVFLSEDAEMLDKVVKKFEETISCTKLTPDDKERSGMNEFLTGNDVTGEEIVKDTVNLNEGSGNTANSIKVSEDLQAKAHVTSNIKAENGNDDERKKSYDIRKGEKKPVQPHADEINNSQLVYAIIESHDLFYYVHTVYRQRIRDICDSYKVDILWNPKEYGHRVCIKAKNQSGDTEKAFEATHNLLHKIKSSWQNWEFDVSTVAANTKEEMKDLLERFSDVVCFEEHNGILQVYGENGEMFNLVKKSLNGILDPIDVSQKSFSLQRNDLQFPGRHTVSKSAESDMSHTTLPSIKREATVGEDMLAYLYQVYKEDLKKKESRHGVTFEWKGGPCIFIYPAPGNIHCTEQSLDSAYDAFVSLVQDLHAKLESKDIDLTGKNIHPSLASQAMNDTNNKHKNVLIKETDAKFVYKVFGEQAKIKEAVDTFYSYLELLPPSGRHRRHKDSETGRRAYQRQSSKESLTDIRLQFTSENGITVSVRHGNITKESVDIICNAANSQLKHAGGVANAIVKAGGQSIQKESFDIIRDKGRDLVMSEVVYTHAGKLDCQFVFHVVGPRWDPERERQIRKDLYNCCMNLLTMADKDMKLHSIAIPAIGTGIYGVPKTVCAQQMAYAVDDFIRYCFQGHLRDIRFIDIDFKTVDIFTKAFEKFRGQPGTLGKISSVDQVEDKMHANSGTPVRSYASVTMDNMIHQSSSPVTGTRPKSHPGTAARVDSTASMVDKTNRKDSNSNNDKQCSICLDDMNDPKTLRCKHRFCKKCIKQSEKHQGKTCPVCKDVYGLITGNMPKGSMVHKSSKIPLPGYEAFGSIVITYDIPSGCQGEEHPNPGTYFSGTTRTAYLPDNFDGRDVLKLLKIAFDRRLTFTVGTSHTTGFKDCVVWNDIHHKTCTHGGPQRFGYPDMQYLSRVKEELTAKGVTLR